MREASRRVRSRRDVRDARGLSRSSERGREWTDAITVIATTRWMSDD